MLLVPILVAPALAGLACLLLPSYRAMAWLGFVGFSTTLLLGVLLLQRVVLAGTAVTEAGGCFSADALSGWMVLLISVVSLATSLYAGRYFGLDLAAGTVTTGRVREFFVLTPLFVTGM